MSASRRIRIVVFLLTIVALAVALASPTIQADNLKLTYAYFMNPVELPGGKVVQAGVYAFKLVDETPTVKVIQILSAIASGTLPPSSPVNSDAFVNPAPMAVVATLVAVPDFKNRPGNAIATYYQGRDGGNAALRTVIFDPDPNALVFVYPAERAVALAKTANRAVPSTTSDVSNAAAMKTAPLRVITVEGSNTDIVTAFGKPGDVFPPEPGGPRGGGGGYNAPR